MNSHERAYDFHKLLYTANTLNHMSAIEYGQNGLAFKKQHNKMDNVWEALHPLQPDELRCNWGDYSLIPDNDSIVGALREGLKEAQQMMRVLNMAPSVQCQAKKRIWYDKPWVVERSDPKSFAYSPSGRVVSGEDGDSEVLRDQLQVQGPNDLNRSSTP